MEKASGTLRRLTAQADARRALVEFDGGPACPRCAAGRGCGAGVFGSRSGPRRVEALLAPDLEVREGDRVEVGFRSGDLLHAALVVYGPALGGAVAAAALAYGAGGTDAGTALAAIAGLGAGLGASRLYLRRTSCLSRLRPVIERRLPASGGDAAA
ncbi:MAG: SoxR reducing system RseC family protein [Woeseiaceae bacterium]|nr:SoxR reducing system RseC family protein [Woeseiaceae bacterium]